MIVEIDRSGTAAGLEKGLAAVLEKDGVRGVMILAADGNGFLPSLVDPLLKSSPVPVFGGIFPQVVVGRENLERGTILLGMKKMPRIRIIPGLNAPDFDAEQIFTEGFSVEPGDGRLQTLFIFIDGFSRNIDALIGGLFNIYGLEINYVGGGAGSLEMVSKPCLFSNEGLLQEAAVLALLDLPSSIGVGHGWQPISGPYKVTESDRNRIVTLDWRPAFDVFREVVASFSLHQVTEDNFFDAAKAFPFGMGRLGAEMIIRDPVSVGAGKSLLCVGDVPRGSYLHVMKGDVDSLVRAAVEAREIGLKGFTGDLEGAVTLFIDCISRVLFLEEQFPRELEAVARGAPPLVGALSIGEIANTGRAYLEFYNKTAVVAIIGE